jgi:type IV secretory pathway VirJ component
MKCIGLVGILLMGAAASAWADPAGPLVPAAVVVPEGPMRGLVVLLSDHGGLTQADRDAAAALAHDGALVAEIDSDRLVARLDATQEDCHFMVPDFEGLSRQLQRDHHGETYYAPILAGRGLGGALAEAVLAQAWPTTIAGAATLDPSATIDTAKPLCGDPLALHNTLQGFWSAGFTESGDRHRVAALKAAGMAVTIEAATTLDALIAPHLRPASDVDDLPLVELPVDHPADLLAIVLSGDGGWRDIDMDLAEDLHKSGLPVIGFDCLRYFWSKKTPERTAQDLAAVLQVYMAKFQASRVVLIGYSFGADVLPFAYNRLPADLQASIVQMSLLGFGTRADFEITMTGWLGSPPSIDAPPVAPEIARVPADMIQCFYGTDEDDSACPALPKGAEIIRMPGGHHFDGDYAGLASRILAGLARRSGR